MDHFDVSSNSANRSPSTAALACADVGIAADEFKCAATTRPAIETTDRKLRILIAEDNALIRLLIAKLLNKRGHIADMVVNGREAVAAVIEASYDLVLMDMQMPEMDGMAATATIRNLSGSERLIPIIALTGNALGGQREICLAAGMNDYLSKPFDVTEFYAAIDRCVRDNLICSRLR